MSFLLILKMAAALSTAAVGVVGLVKPSALYGFTGLKAEGVRGISELRGSFGGLFIGLGLAPLLIGPAAYPVLGIGYAALGAARAFSIVFDKSYAQSNLISLGSEIVLGLILVL